MEGLEGFKKEINVNIKEGKRIQVEIDMKNCITGIKEAEQARNHFRSNKNDIAAAFWNGRLTGYKSDLEKLKTVYEKLK
jgi:hypothetical protein